MWSGVGCLRDCYCGLVNGGCFQYIHGGVNMGCMRMGNPILLSTGSCSSDQFTSHVVTMNDPFEVDY
jgi:hypothetical protein